MNESPVVFGTERSLVGVVTDPVGETHGVGLVFLNAGFTHHVGPQRLYVQCARRLADRGYTALRFDYSGIGDSPRGSGATVFADRALQEAHDAMDLLESSRGIRRFVLFGICWGADNAVRVAIADRRVIGLVAVDSYAVMSARWFLRFYARRLLSPARWANVLRGKSAVFGRAVQLFRYVAKSGESRPDEVGEGEHLLPVRSPSQVRAELTELVDRGVHLCFAYARVGGSYDRYLLDFRERMAELEATGRLRVRVFMESDHVFTLLHSQGELLDYVEDWARDLSRTG